MAIETGAPIHKEELIDVGPILEREATDRQLAGARVSLSFAGAAREAQILGDAIALRRLFANVTYNAIAYGREARISAQICADRLVVTTDDNGPGIDPELREIVLEPFVRLEQSRNRNTGGAGWAWPSPARWRRRMAGGSASTRRLGAAPGPSSSCRCF